MPRMTQQPAIQGYIRDIPDYPPVARGRSVRDALAEDDEEEIEIRERRPSGDLPEPPLTKAGKPDRRFLGARHLPPPEDDNPDYRRARTGGQVGGVHITLNNKPDRRFKENRNLTEDEVMSQFVDIVNSRYRQH